MTHDAVEISMDSATGGLVLSKSNSNSPDSLDGGASESVHLHPIWLRERTQDPEHFDALTHQRLFDPYKLPLDIRIMQANISGGVLHVTFSDSLKTHYRLDDIFTEINWSADPLAPPRAAAWDHSLSDIRRANWMDLDKPDALRHVLDGFFRDGFCLMENTPHHMDALKELAARFGYIRETNFGVLFNVRTKIDPTDLAYTNRELSAHTDNPYREPVPGIQFLHCLENEAQGGLGTLMDGLAIAQALRAQAPDEYAVLRETPVTFRYESAQSIFENSGTLIEENPSGHVRRIRHSSRLSFVPVLPPKQMALFYAGRARLGQMANDPRFRVTFPYRPGTLLMMDNYRLLHGRTAYDDAAGHRHLQGCYIDHDGINSLYRVLRRDSTALCVGRND